MAQSQVDDSRPNVLTHPAIHPFPRRLSHPRIEYTVHYVETGTLNHGIATRDTVRTALRVTRLRDGFERRYNRIEKAIIGGRDGRQKLSIIAKITGQLLWNVRETTRDSTRETFKARFLSVRIKKMQLFMH